MTQNKLELIIDGKVFERCSSFETVRSMEQFAHTISFSFHESSRNDNNITAIREGSRFEARLNGRLCSAGHLDSVEHNYDSNSTSASAAGRSLTGDLVDCSAEYGKGTFKNNDIAQIAKKLIDPFGLILRIDVGAELGTPFKSFSIQDGETVYETLERACRMRALLLMTSSSGHPVIAEVGKHKTATIIGDNVIRCQARGDLSNRFAAYVFKGQIVGGDDLFGRTAAQPTSGVVFDEEMLAAGAKQITQREELQLDSFAQKRRRQLILHAEHSESSSQLKARATWERNVRAGRAVRLSYTLPGWENAEGLWQPNVLARVFDRRLPVDTTLLIVSVRQTLTEGEGATTELALCDPRAMTVQPLTKQKKDKHGRLPYLSGSAPE